MTFRKILSITITLIACAAVFYSEAEALVVHNNIDSSVKLQSALQDAASNGDDDVINLTAGTFSVVPIGNNPFFYQAAPSENHSLTIIGPDPATTILDGNLTQQVIHLDTSAVVGDASADITLSGVTVFHGSEGGAGGGLEALVTDAGIVIENCVFSSNEVTANGAPVFDGSGGAAAIIVDGSGHVRITDTVFEGNQAENAGGSLALQSTNGNVTLVGDVVRDSQADDGGGGIAIEALGGETLLANSVIQDNVTGLGGIGGGGAVIVGLSSVKLINNVFFNNFGAVGGGATLSSSFADVANSIFRNNDALSGGGDLYFLNDQPISLSNNIFSEVCVGDPGACDLSALDVAQSGNLIGVDPLFADPVAGDFHLSAGSPAINAGLAGIAGLPETDFEGEARVIGPAPDMGADEAADACGNGAVETGEECDDGADNSDTTADACRTSCANPRCGDGAVDTGETCDDGNTTDGDGCSAACQEEAPAGGGTTGEGTGGDTSGTTGGTGGSGGGCNLIR